MGALIIAMVLTQTPTVGPPVEAAPTTVSPPTWHPGATKRLAGALLGGAVGMAVLPVLAFAAASGPCPSGAFCFVNFGTLVALIGAPLLSVVGATLGFALAGGPVSVGAALAGLMGGLGAGLALLLVHRLVDARMGGAPSGLLPVSAGIIVVGLQALALTGRGEVVDDTPALATPVKRLLFETLGNLGGLVLEGALVALTFLALRTDPALGAALAIGGLALAPLLPWWIHTSLGGRGSLAASYLGWAASLAIGAACIGLIAFSIGTGAAEPRNATMLAGASVLGVLAITLGTPLFLEWSHGDSVLSPGPGTSRIEAQVALAPVAGPSGLSGAAIGLRGSF
jgi:hypothetical protein